MTASSHRRLVRVTIEGRVTVEAIEMLATTLGDALAQPGEFDVLFDRRAMTAPTPAGRAALEEWAARVMPQVATQCRRWVDVFDERRAASLARAAANQAEPDVMQYEYRMFTDLESAEEWLTEPGEQ